jgi:membrane protein DedA with SNARE-associated domain
VTRIVATHGVYAVFLLMAIDAVFPAASELVMLVGGALATAAFAEHATVFGITLSKGSSTFVAVALAGTFGYLVGSFAGWAIGRYGGRPLVERHRRWFHLSPTALERAEAWFARWGAAGVLIGRLVPLVRSFVSIPAGVFRMPLGTYALLTLLGSAIWAFALAGVGWAAGTSYSTFHHDWRYVEVAIVITIVFCVMLTAFRGRRRA